MAMALAMADAESVVSCRLVFWVDPERDESGRSWCRHVLQFEGSIHRVTLSFLSGGTTLKRNLPLADDVALFARQPFLACMLVVRLSLPALSRTSKRNASYNCTTRTRATL